MREEAGPQWCAVRRVCLGSAGLGVTLHLLATAVMFQNMNCQRARA